MKYLLSIAWRTFEVIGLEEVMSSLKENDLEEIGGIELGVEDYGTMKTILEFCIKRKKIFQCHTPNFKDLDLIYPYLLNVDKLSKIYERNINVVVHSKEDDDIEKSIIETKEYVFKILQYVKQKNLNVTISLENLNYHHDRNRINMSLIDNILVDFDELKFTYDIGHDIFDNKQNTMLSKLQAKKINNVHFHNVKEDKDHVQVFETTENIPYLKNAIQNLKDVKYEGDIVVEVGVNTFEGKTVREMLDNYIKSIKEIKKEFNK